LRKLKLKRISATSDGTWGALLKESGNPLCLTAEIPNTFVPCGTYICKLQTHNQENGRSYPAYEIMNVAGHKDIEIHIGNSPVLDSKGCVLLGMEFGTVLGNRPAVLFSTSAYETFMNYVGRVPEFELTIEDP